LKIILKTYTFRQLFFRHFYFAAAGETHRVQTVNAGP
jgi:hypothetical protein